MIYNIGIPMLQTFWSWLVYVNYIMIAINHDFPAKFVAMATKIVLLSLYTCPIMSTKFVDLDLIYGWFP